MQTEGRHPILRYGLAVVATALATAVTVALRDQLSEARFPLYFAGVMLAAWYGGFGPALVATALSAVAADYYFLHPEEQLAIRSLEEALQLALFVLVAMLAAGLTQTVRSTGRRAERARAAADDAQERLAFLAEASTLLASSLDWETTLTNVAHLAVPYIADWCVVDVVQPDGSLNRLAVAHVDPEKERWARDLERRYPGDPDAPQGVFQVIRTGVPELYREIGDDKLVAAARDEEHLRILREVGLSSAIVVPLIARETTLGAITLVMAESGRHFGERDLTLAEDLARRAAIAMDNARLFQERTHAARTLQQSLLPPDLPPIPGLELAARYRPAGHGLDVGGDFYDVFGTGEEEWAVVIGDVCGKGVDAAALTGLARYTIRAAARHGETPSGVLRTLNEAILGQRTDQRFCTVAYADLRPTPEGADLTVTCGGHPAPLVIRTDGKVESVHCLGSLIGLFPDPQLEDVPVHLGPGDSAVFYTDGVTDIRGLPGPSGLERLQILLAEAAGLDPATLAERIEADVLKHQGGEPRDDVALVVLRVSAGGAGV